MSAKPLPVGLAGLTLLAGVLALQPATARAVGWPVPEAAARPSAQEATRVVVLVLASGGKFVGDDIGGALVTIRDARSGEVLASGRTRGGSGPPYLPTVEVTRLEELPEEDAGRFEATLPLDGPRLVEVIAEGPLAAQAAAARATTTVWLLPGATAADANRVVVTLHGLTDPRQHRRRPRDCHRTVGRQGWLGADRPSVGAVVVKEGIPRHRAASRARGRRRR